MVGGRLGINVSGLAGYVVGILVLLFIVDVLLVAPSYGTWQYMFNEIMLSVARQNIVCQVGYGIALMLFSILYLYLVFRADEVGTGGKIVALFLYVVAVLVALSIDMFVAVVVPIVMAGIAAFIMWDTDSGALALTFVAGLLVLGIVVAPVAVAGAIWGAEASAHAVSVTDLDKPINVYGVERIIPLEMAYAYAADRIQIPTHRLFEEECNLVYMNGSLWYTWLIEPEGFWNEFWQVSKGAVFVSADRYPPRLLVIQRDIAWGVHVYKGRILWIENIRTAVQAASGRYGVMIDVDDNIEVLYNGRVYILVPVVRWEHYGSMGVLPVLDGYGVVDESGDVKYYTVDEIKDMEMFSGVPLVPPSIARYWVEQYRYSVGWWTVVSQHRTYTIRDVGGNPQPYLVVGEDGRLYWLFTVEPEGETYSIYYVFYVDASVPVPRIIRYRFDTPMIGASRIQGYIQQAKPMYDWGRLSLADPIPNIVNGTLYWKVSIITSDKRGLVGVALVNARTGETLVIENKGGVYTGDMVAEILAAMATAGLNGTVAIGGEHGNMTGTGNATGSGDVYTELRMLRSEVQRLLSKVDELLKRIDELEEKINATADATAVNP